LGFLGSLVVTQKTTPRLPWIEPGQEFPPVAKSWGAHDPAPGLLAAGGDLSTDTLLKAYARGIFPWYSEGQPILWWSPDPRMVLRTDAFKLHRSLRKRLAAFIATPGCEIRIDHDFASTIRACAQVPRDGQGGTWIVAAMREAYIALHRAGYAHSVETWVDGELVGGLYCTAIGRAVFGESMFSRRTDMSKIALAALVALCRAQGIALIDCQQNTSHLASLGAREMPRAEFCAHVRQALPHRPEHDDEPEFHAVRWQFEPVHWNQLDTRLLNPP
jgi:leucyl/phenylalanyl-tRNA---protein transferase